MTAEKRHKDQAEHLLRNRADSYTAYECALNDIAQALADAEQRGAESAKAEAQPAAACSCHSCEVLPVLHEQVAQMCEYLGSKRDEVPCDSWHLLGLIVKLKAEAQPAGTGWAADAYWLADWVTRHTMSNRAVSVANRLLETLPPPPEPR